jgi:hypothetical protein
VYVCKMIALNKYDVTCVIGLPKKKHFCFLWALSFPWFGNTLKCVTRLHDFRKLVGLTQSHVQFLPLLIGVRWSELKNSRLPPHIISQSWYIYKTVLIKCLLKYFLSIKFYDYKFNNNVTLEYTFIWKSITCKEDSRLD